MSEELDIQTMHAYNIHANIPWNDLQYQPVPYYQSPNKPNFDIEKYVTKKGFYMDYHIKTVKDLPSPTHYPTKTIFDQTQNKKHSQKVKINPRIKKGSYIDTIQLESKKIKSSVGLYNLQKTDKQIKQQLRKDTRRQRKIKNTPRPSFYQNTQVKTKDVPGAGNYNPHLEVEHIHKDRMVPDKWVEKHTKQSKYFLKKQRKIPGPSSYRPMSAGTFDRRSFDIATDRKKRNKSLNKSFGVDAKFVYDRADRKKIKQKRPDPTRYNLTIDWKRKSEKKVGWQGALSTRSVSVYH